MSFLKSIVSHTVFTNEPGLYEEIIRPAILTDLSYDDKQIKFINESGLYSLIKESNPWFKGKVITDVRIYR